MKVTFPSPSAQCVNMMPIVMSDPDTVPIPLHGYLPLIEACHFEAGSVVYLTVDESEVSPGTSQRRGGIHTEAFKGGRWGGGWGGSDPKGGIFMASTDGACRIWRTQTDDVDEHGGVLSDLSASDSFVCEPNVLYWITDRTPHEALPSPVGPKGKVRQFFRLVGPDVSVWYARHNTPNPLGVAPRCPINDNKFA